MTEQIQILKHRLEYISRGLKITLASLKRVFNAFGRKAWLGAPDSLTWSDAFIYIYKKVCDMKS